MIITTDENGNVVDSLKQRNEEIKAKLKPTLDLFLNEKKLLLNLKRPVNLGYRFATQIESVLNQYGQMSADDIKHLDYDTINDYWLKFLDLISYYNGFIEIVLNKQLFCSFMGINTEIIKDLEKSEDVSIRNLMKRIHDSTVGLGFMASESGNASSSAIRTRLSAANGDGQNMISASEDKLLSTLPQEATPQELKRQLEAIVGGEIKLVGDKN